MDGKPSASEESQWSLSCFPVISDRSLNHMACCKITDQVGKVVSAHRAICNFFHLKWGAPRYGQVTLAGHGGRFVQH